MASHNEEITSLFKTALSALSEQNFESSLNSFEKIIELDPRDADAHHSKVIVLIKDEKYSKALEALKALEKVAPNEKTIPFSKAYCLCSLNKLDEASKEIKKSKDKTSAAVQKLKAQIAFKMEDFPTCIQIYYDLLQETAESHPDFPELLANYQAAIGASLLSDNPVNYKTIDSAPSTHELLFNLACIAISEEKLDKAGKLLDEATSLCIRVLEDELCSKEDIFQELAPLKLQQAYVKQLQGDISGSARIYNELLENKVDDSSVVTVATNNLLSIQGIHEDVFETLHTLKKRIADDPKSSYRLLKKQTAVLAGNEMALFLCLKQFPHSFAKAKKMEKFHPTGYRKMHPAVVHFHQNRPKLAIAELQKQIQDDATNIPLNFALVQLHIQMSRYDLAVDQLETLRSNLQRHDQALPGLIGSLAWLYEQISQPKKAQELLEEATDMESAYRELYQSVLQRKQAFSLLGSNQPEAAAAQFQTLLDLDPEDHESLRGLIKAFSLYEPSTAEQYLEAYPKPTLDPSALEASYLKSLKHPTQTSSVAPSKKAKNKKNKRHNKPPKNFNPNSKPDPQRWLRMAERSYFKNKSNKLIRGNQGASVAQAKEEPTPPPPQVPATSSKAKASKSKKKKGGR